MEALDDLSERTKKGHRQSDEERAMVSQPNNRTVQRTRKGYRQSDEHWNCFKGRERAIVS